MAATEVSGALVISLVHDKMKDFNQFLKSANVPELVNQFEQLTPEEFILLYSDQLMPLKEPNAIARFLLEKTSIDIASLSTVNHRLLIKWITCFNKLIEEILKD